MRQPNKKWNPFTLVAVVLALPLCLSACTSPPVTPASEHVSSNKPELGTDTSTEDKDRLAIHRDVLTTLKTNKNPPLDEDYNIVTAADLEANQNRQAGSPTAYTEQSSYTPSYSSSSAYPGSSSASGSSYSYSDPKPGTNAWLQQYHSDHAIQETYKAQEALNRGDIRAARRHAQWAEANMENYRSLGGR